MKKEELSQFTFDFMNEFFILESKGNALQVPSTVQEERLSICKTCEFYDAEKNMCKDCGCYLPHKTKDPYANCPKDHWFANSERWNAFDFDDILSSLQSKNETWKKPLN